MRIGAALVAAGALLVGPAACGSDEDSASDSNSTVVEKQAGASGWQLTWSDEFDGPAGEKPDPAKWRYKTGDMPDNEELQVYTDSAQNAATDGEGSLVITALEGAPPGSSCATGPCKYTSARIKTEGKFSQEYGRFEARIQVPTGKGIWPAFWMLGDTKSVRWPEKGEIDVMEILGNDPSKLYGTLHGPGYSGGGAISNPYELPSGESFADSFHKFAVEWEPKVVRWYADDQLYATRTPAGLPAGTRWVYDDRPYYMLLNLAVGGNWPGSPNSATKFPSQLKVDYVRVFEQTEGEAPAS